MLIYLARPWAELEESELKVFKYKQHSIER